MRGLREVVRRASGTDPLTDASIDVIVNTGDDWWLAGLRITPDFDSMLYTLSGQNDEQRGWGRVGESERVAHELQAWDVTPEWFTLGDLDLGTHATRRRPRRALRGELDALLDADVIPVAPSNPSIPVRPATGFAICRVGAVRAWNKLGKAVGPSLQRHIARHHHIVRDRGGVRARTRSRLSALG